MSESMDRQTMQHELSAGTLYLAMSILFRLPVPYTRSTTEQVLGPGPGPGPAHARGAILPSNTRQGERVDRGRP